MLVLRRHSHWLERHAADGAMAGPLLHDLGMHGAGVERACWQGLLRLGLISEILRRVRGEFGLTSGRAEIICEAAIFVLMRCLVRIDGHPAHRIEHALLCWHVVLMAAMAMGVSALC